MDGWWLGYNRYDEVALVAEARLLLDGVPLPSTSQLQRRFQIGWNRASRLMEQLEADRYR